MRLLTIAAGSAVLMLIATAGAAAHTTIIEPPESHHPYKQWIDDANVPTPDVTLTVVEGEACMTEDAGEALACTVPSLARVWMNTVLLAEDEMSAREAFLHEIGHNFDADDMEPWARRQFRHLRHSSQPWWGLDEVFADAYMGCALVRRNYLASRPASRYAPRVCKLIRHAYAAAQ